MSRIWSGQQDTVFTWFVDGTGNLVVRARAGTGKTTTIVEAVKRWLKANPGKTAILCAFNRRIADELTTRFAGCTGVQVKTLHGIGYGIVQKYWEGIRVEDTRNRVLVSRKDQLTERVCGQAAPDAIKRLVSKLHTLGREIMPRTTVAELVALAEAFDCEPDEQWESEGWDTERIAGYALRAMVLAATERPRTGIDFADMIFLPIYNGWVNPAYDLVVVDEAQDMTSAQLALARGICKGRIAIVGDDRQAIYGFRGADPGSLDRLKDELHAAELGLTTTYRCGRVIVDLAARIVPDFEAAPTNAVGVVRGLNPDKLADAAQLGDFVLSRTNAPLVETAMKLLAQGKRTKVAGKDIGNGLLTLVKRLAGKARSVPEFLDRLAGWQLKEIRRATKAGQDEKKIDAIMDKADMLRAMSEGAANVSMIERQIVDLFTDDGLGAAGVVTCSSVHRAKGLEADRVFVLADTLKDTTIEEQNISYVAITRARHELVFVGEGLGAKVEEAA